MTHHLSRRLVVVAAAAGLVAAAVGSPAHAAPSTAASADGLSLIAVRHSLLGTHTWYQQTYRGLPVLGGFYATHTDTRTGAVRVQDGRLSVAGHPGIQAGFARDHAQSATTTRLRGQLIRSELVIVAGATAKLGWLVLTETARGTVQTVLDAATGSALSEQYAIKEVNGSGTVFNPNAVVTLQNESLTDSNNQNLAVFAPAYQTVTLTQLNAGVNTLVGAYANNVSKKPVSSSTRTYNFNRSQAGFEQVMGYYHITVAQEYIHSLGFTNVNNESQNYRTTGLTADNSFYEPNLDRITFGTGGVDDAEDAEVIWHEYGHAIQDDQVPGFGSGSQAGAIGEGFGDYWAFTMSVPVSADTATTPLACIADWDSVSYTSGTPHCLRRVDGTKVYPGDLDGEVHDDGEIWSRALFDIHGALGRTTANTIILEAQFNFAPNTSMPSAANQIVATAQALFGAGAANACTTAFHNRGIL
jgi:Fungalysin/Thermolysin Propeptide Motif/Fungalysin metallopeptidase (M36)